MPTRSLPHVFRRNGHHYLRIVVPAALRGLVGKRELRYSLRTGYQAEACRRGALVAASVKEWLQGAVMAELKAENLGALIEQFVRARIDELANAYTSEMKNHIQAALTVAKAPPAGRTVQEIEDELNALHESVAKEDISPIVKKADAFLQSAGYQNFHDSDEFAKFCIGLVKAEGNFLRYAAATRYKQDMIDKTREELLDFECYIKLIEPNTNTLQIQQQWQPADSNLLPGKASEIFEKYFTTNRANIGVEYQNEIKSIFEAFMLIVGDIELRHFTTKDANTYKETLTKMPKAWGKKNEFKNSSLQEILSKNYEENLSSYSVNKHITTISNFFEYAIKHHYMKENYITGMKIPIKKGRPRKQRDMWEKKHLEILLSKDKYPLNGPAHMFWLPIFGLLTGARLEEIAQLRCCDVKNINGIVCIDINGENGKRIKNEASERIVPLHKILVEELNFTSFVDTMRKGEKSQLFPELYGFASFSEKIASSHFSKFKIRELGITNHKVNFHSFRHNARNMVPPSIIDENAINDYFGWESKGEGNARYRKASDVVFLYDLIVKNMTIDFDYSILKSSPWAKGVAPIHENPRKEKRKRITWKE